MMRARFGVAAMLLSAAGVAHAQAPGARTHDGFFLQLDLGAGYMQSTNDEGGQDLELDGAAGEFSVAVGYNVLPGIIIGAQYWGVGVNDPDFTQNGVSTNIDVTLALSGIGANITYYFQPYNVYIQATPSITMLTAEVGPLELETDAGLGIRLAVGKEWWVSDNWALGLNGQFAYSTNDEDVAGGGTWNSTWFGLAFSATYD